ncbi:MAG: hypothetical protein MJE77_19595 [Proteobacteria bacterium]|nr:hypothetical protein [Pseudomonadota bacterium]
MEEAKGKLVIRLESSRSSSAGAAAAYLMRRLAARAGSYAPGIQEHLFYEIGQRFNGVGLEQVERWIQAHSDTLSTLGYYILARRVSVPTDAVKEWTARGNGYRAAILMTDGTTLHNDSSLSTSHAVGLTVNDSTSGVADAAPKNGLLMVDPWPGLAKFSNPPATLDRAHRAHKYRALLLYWAGYG